MAQKPTPAVLGQILSDCADRYDEQLYGGFTAAHAGHCDAFALALVDYLALHDVPSALRVISRIRRDDDGVQVDHNLLSHVVVDALGTTWDWSGANACVRWAAEWIQPTEEGCVDLFEDTDISQNALCALRQEWSGRPTDDTHRQHFFDNLVRTHIPDMSKEALQDAWAAGASGMATDFDTAMRALTPIQRVHLASRWPFNSDQEQTAILLVVMDHLRTDGTTAQLAHCVQRCSVGQALMVVRRLPSHVLPAVLSVVLHHMPYVAKDVLPAVMARLSPDQLVQGLTDHLRDMPSYHNLAQLINLCTPDQLIVVSATFDQHADTNMPTGVRHHPLVVAARSHASLSEALTTTPTQSARQLKM